jgi:hypothetical protein
MNAEFTFKPIGFSWVAIHPEPLGIINFIGDFFWGNFPNIFYNYLLKELFNQKYTIIARTRRITIDHWSVINDLIQEKNNFNFFENIYLEAKKLNYQTQLYQQSCSSKQANVFWLGHGQGCKYIALLEIISNFSNKNYQIFAQEYLGRKKYLEILKILPDNNIDNLAINNQPSIFLSPIILNYQKTNIVNFFPKIFKYFLPINPTSEQIYNFIKYSHLFNYTAIIGFEQDKIAQKTVEWLKQELPQQINSLLCQQIVGTHSLPISCYPECHHLTEIIIKFIDTLKIRIENQ